MMIITNLNQLKREMKPGTRFEILSHIRTECIGQIRKVTAANTVGFYSLVPSDLNSKISKGNNGLGAFLGWESAKDWIFDSEGKCSLRYPPGSKETLISFRIIDDGKMPEA